MTYVLALGLGPVQEFIITARRTRDLWFGSHLLSQASQAAAQALLDGRARLVFPSASTLNQTAQQRGQISNKILAQIDGSDEHVRGLAGAATLAAQNRVMALSSTALARLGREQDTARAQLADLLETYWAAAPVGDGEHAYAHARHEAERLLAARKNTREFAPVTWGSARPKSQLDGQRESVVGELTPPARQRLGLRDAEELCGPGFVKRTGLRGEEDEARFMSTSHVAAQPYLARLARRDAAEVKRDWQAYLSVLEAGRLSQDRLSSQVAGDSVLGRHDGRVLYTSRLHELASEGESHALDAAMTALRRFLHAHPATSPVFGTLPPDPYYMVFQADGDDMGRVIDQHALKGADTHSELSEALASFAGEAGRIVAEHQGSLVYAGGDDVLALLPLHTALDCVTKVTATYRNSLTRFATPAAPATLSGGLVIAHFLAPLQDTLHAVRAAEQRAKAIKGKDALFVSLRRRGGSPLQLGGKTTQVLPALGILRTLSGRMDLPNRLAYDVRVLARELGHTAPPGLAEQELARILTRKRAERGERAVNEGSARQLLEAASTLGDGAGPTPTPAGRTDHAGLRTLSDALVIAQVLARAHAQAGEEA